MYAERGKHYEFQAVIAAPYMHGLMAENVAQQFRLTKIHACRQIYFR